MRSPFATSHGHLSLVVDTGAHWNDFSAIVGLLGLVKLYLQWPSWQFGHE